MYRDSVNTGYNIKSRRWFDRPAIMIPVGFGAVLLLVGIGATVQIIINMLGK